MGRIVTVAIGQMEISSDVEKNYEQAERMAKKACEKGAQLFCLPELFATQYFPQFEESEQDFSEPIPGKTSEFLSRLAKENKLTIVGGTIFEKKQNGNSKSKKGYNTCLIYGPDGSLLSTYRKMHVPHDVCFYEKNYFLEGDLGYVVADTPVCKIAPMICFDQWFSEPARIVALMGAELIVYPTAIGTVDGIPQTEGDWQDAWITVMRGHAIANSVPIIAINRVGREKSMDFWGNSFVCDAFGKVIAKAEKREQLLLAEIDIDHGKSIREGWGFFSNRRPKTYSKLTNDG